jgi:polar amino acid transport system ATP-binding protein
VNAVLEVRGLVRRYGTATVLDGVDLTVEEHRVVTLIGSSGSGKSTLLRCVDLLEEIDDGQVLLDGVDVSDPGPTSPPRSAGWRSCSRRSICSRT